MGAVESDDCRSADPLPQSEIKKIVDTIYQRFYVIYTSA